ncbi:hypothetical protein V2J09_019767 [Rumex salicifolius]
MAITTTMSCMKLQSLIFEGFSSKIHPVFLPKLLTKPLSFQSSFSCRNLPPFKTKPKHLLKAFSEELPTDLVEEAKFVPLNAEDPNYGPPALLLLGFELGEALKIKQLLKDLDGDFLEIIYYTEDMIDRSLWDAMNTKQQNVEDLQVAKSVPRICFLSGLTGEEMMMFIDAFPETGLEPAIFAALVPNSAEKPLRELIEEIMGDHEMMGDLTLRKVRGPKLFITPA